MNFHVPPRESPLSHHTKLNTVRCPEAGKAAVPCTCATKHAFKNILGNWVFSSICSLQGNPLITSASTKQYGAFPGEDGTALRAACPSSAFLLSNQRQWTTAISSKLQRRTTSTATPPRLSSKWGKEEGVTFLPSFLKAYNWWEMDEAVGMQGTLWHPTLLWHLKRGSPMQTPIHNMSKQHVPETLAQSNSWTFPCHFGFSIQLCSLAVQFVVSILLDSWDTFNSASVCVLFLNKEVLLPYGNNSVSSYNLQGTDIPPVFLPYLLPSCWEANLKMQPTQIPLPPI